MRGSHGGVYEAESAVVAPELDAHVLEVESETLPPAQWAGATQPGVSRDKEGISELEVHVVDTKEERGYRNRGRLQVPVEASPLRGGRRAQIMKIFRDTTERAAGPHA